DCWSKSAGDCPRLSPTPTHHQPTQALPSTLSRMLVRQTTPTTMHAHTPVARVVATPSADVPAHTHA
ncbi:unnamed protein product, partial [Citrullus colocynthis]